MLEYNTYSYETRTACDLRKQFKTYVTKMADQMMNKTMHTFGNAANTHYVRNLHLFFNSNKNMERKTKMFFYHFCLLVLPLILVTQTLNS